MEKNLYKLTNRFEELEDKVEVLDIFFTQQKMAEDSTPVLKGSLDECFIEQQHALKQLTIQYEDLEDKVEVLDSFFTQLDDNQEENRRNLEKFEKRVVELETELEKTELLEERVSVLKIQSI